VFEAAASFPERINSELYVPNVLEDPLELESRIVRWVHMVRSTKTTSPQWAREMHESDAAILDRFSDIGVPVAAGLRSVRLRDPDVLPEWAEAVVAFVAAQCGQEDVANSAPDEPGSMSLLSGFYRAASALLRTDFLDRFIRMVTMEARRGFAEDLVEQLVGVCTPCMQFEMQLLSAELSPAAWLDSPQIRSTPDEWTSRFERFPGLAFVIGTLCVNWRQNAVEVLTRLDEDGDRLAQLPFSIDSTDPLTEVRTSAGDRHNGGRSVALLRFGSGRGVVYKPKDLRHGVAMMKLLEFLNDQGAPLNLAVRDVLPRGEYGWEERIEPAPTNEPGGFNRFYRRLGMLTRLVQVLSGRDFWADNLLAEGEFPHFIDLECLYTPPTPLPTSLPATSRDLSERLERTALSTSILLMSWLPSPDMPGRDFGCLSHADELITEWGTPFPLPPYRPWNDQGLADPWEYAEEVVQGFRDMHDVLVRAQSQLLADDGPLMSFLEIPVRHILRSTPEYYQILRTSLHPFALINGTTRDTLLAALYSLPCSNDPSESGLAITNAEVDALRQLDVPTFMTETTSTSLFAPPGLEVRGHFKDSAEQHVRGGVTDLDAPGLEADVRLLRTAIDAARGGAEVPLHITCVPSALSVDEASEAADQIATLIRDARGAPLGIGRGWLGLFWNPMLDVWGVEPAGHDLCGGALGPAMFLGAHSSVTGASQSGAVCLETLDDILNDNRLPAAERSLPGLAGPGAVTYVASYAAEWLRQPHLAVMAGEVLFANDSQTEGHNSPFDQGFGLAELLLQCLRWRRFGNAASGAFDAMALRWANSLLQALSNHGTRRAASDRLAEWLPVEGDAIVLALATFLSHYPNEGFAPDVMRTIKAHRFDLAHRGGRMAAMAVSRLAEISGHSDYRLQAVDHQALGTRALLQRIEEAQLAAKYLGHTDALEESSRCLRIIIDRKAATGGWIPDRLADDGLNLSALDGTCALGLALLRYIRADVPALGIFE
jgi:lantibiotic modifying enzyme